MSEEDILILILSSQLLRNEHPYTIHKSEKLPFFFLSHPRFPHDNNRHASSLPFPSLPVSSFLFSSLPFTLASSLPSRLPLLSPTSRLSLFLLYARDSELQSYSCCSRCTKAMLSITSQSAGDSQYLARQDSGSLVPLHKRCTVIANPEFSSMWGYRKKYIGQVNHLIQYRTLICSVRLLIRGLLRRSVRY